MSSKRRPGDLAQLKQNATQGRRYRDNKDGHGLGAFGTAFPVGRPGVLAAQLLDQVDFDHRGIWLSADDVKDSEDAFIPGGTAAMAFLEELVAQARSRGAAHLITWRPTFKDPERAAREPWRPITSPKRSWATAMKTIEKEFGRRWRFHDLRAAYITQIVITAGPIAGQRLARHSDYKTTQSYVEVADEVLRAAAEHAGERPALRIVRGHKQ